MSNESSRVKSKALGVADIAEELGISRAKAYILVRSDGFPRIILDRRIIVPREAFDRWVERVTLTAAGGE
jgi:predicted DNA-binding transcriptional regulator AlpA